MAGWGLTGEDGPPSPVLKVVELPVVDIKQCFNQSDPTFVAYITSDKICAGYQNGKFYKHICGIIIAQALSGADCSELDFGPGKNVFYGSRYVCACVYKYCVVFPPQELF